MKKVFLTCFVLLCSTFSIVGCFDDTKPEKDSVITPPRDGSYSIGCFSESGEDGIAGTADDEWNKLTYIMSGETVTMEIVSYYTLADGSRGSERTMTKMSGTIAVGEKNADGTYNFDLCISLFKMTVLNQSCVDDYNNAENNPAPYYLYGYGTGSANGVWVLNQERDVTGKSAWSDYNYNDTVDEGEVYTFSTWNIYSIAYVKDDVLYIGNSDVNEDGEDETGDSPANRDTALDPEGIPLLK